jgi:outer membrane protein assembly factor BamB
MSKFSALAVIFLGGVCVASAQMGRTTDWWSYGGDAQRTGWEKNDQKFTKDDVKNFQLLWKMKLDNQQKGVHSLLPPVILGNLIGYRGFKELAFVAGSSDNLWVIDADLARMYWQKHFDTSIVGNSSSGCSAGLTAMPTLPAPIVFRSRAAREREQKQAAAAANGGRNPDGTPRAGGANPSPPPRRTPVRDFFSPKPVYVLSSDGKLHLLNQQDGADVMPPVAFVPPGARAQSLNISEDVIYTTTEGCGATPNAVWALDLDDPSAKATSFVSNGAKFQGLGGPAIGADGTVYVQTGDGESDPASNKYGNTLLALTPRELKVKGYFALPGGGSPAKDFDMNVTTPVVFTHKGHEFVVTAGKDGRLYVLDSSSFGNDHKTPLSQTAPIADTASDSSARGIWGSLSSWEDTDGTRYVLAAVWGPVHNDLKTAANNGDAPNGSIVAFKLQEQDGKPALVPAWISRDMSSPAPPVIAQGVVFALANGEFTRKVKNSKGAATIEERPKGSTHATLYALDGATGKEMWSTGTQVNAPGSLTGLSIANGRLYFTTTDNTITVFGKYLEH